jgi:hypothetical protein
MDIKLHLINEIKIAELKSETVIINELQDALDFLANTYYMGADKMIVYEKQFNPDFFDLSTKMAGEILQKFSTYRAQLAIVGDFTKYKSKSLTDFIFESNKVGRIIFVPTLEVAKEKLAK